MEKTWTGGTSTAAGSSAGSSASAAASAAGASGVSAAASGGTSSSESPMAGGPSPTDLALRAQFHQVPHLPQTLFCAVPKLRETCTTRLKGPPSPLPVSTQPLINRPKKIRNVPLDSRAFPNPVRGYIIYYVP